MRRLLGIILYLFSATGIWAQESPDKMNWSLYPGQAGVLKLGMKADTVYYLFDFSQIEIDDLQLEGIATPALNIFYENLETPTLIAEIKLKKELVIDRIHVLDARFRLSTQVGIGSTLGELRKKYKLGWIHFCDRGHLCARIDELKMLFKLDLREPPTEWLQTENSSMIPDSSKVIEIFIESE